MHVLFNQFLHYLSINKVFPFSKEVSNVGTVKRSKYNLCTISQITKITEITYTPSVSILLINYMIKQIRQPRHCCFGKFIVLYIGYTKQETEVTLVKRVYLNWSFCYCKTSPEVNGVLIEHIEHWHGHIAREWENRHQTINYEWQFKY